MMYHSSINDKQYRLYLGERENKKVEIEIIILEKTNKKSLELDNKSKEVKEIINHLKPTLIKKDNYILKQEDKDKIEKYINQVDKTDDEYKNI